MLVHVKLRVTEYTSHGAKTALILSGMDSRVEVVPWYLGADPLSTDIHEFGPSRISNLAN